MPEIATIVQAVSVMAACWAIISGVGAWKREFIGKRRIELAEQVLAKFFEVKDAIAFIRNPFSSSEEGKTRQRSDSEPSTESELLDRSYIVVERYSKKESVFADFNILKYKFMASFGPETEQIFTDTNKALSSIFVSARVLAYYWQRQGRVLMENDKNIDRMHRHQDIFWDTGSDTDEIRVQLKAIQEKLESATKPCFQEPVGTFKKITKKCFNSI